MKREPYASKNPRTVAGQKPPVQRAAKKEVRAAKAACQRRANTGSKPRNNGEPRAQPKCQEFMRKRTSA